MDKKTATNIIIDLCEMRSKFDGHVRVRPYELSPADIDNTFKYSFFSAAIASLCDKYGITSRDMRDGMRERVLVEQARNTEVKHGAQS